MSNEVRAFLVGLDEQGEHWLAPDERGSYLASMQDAVGGRIEPYSLLFGENIVLYVDDEGLFTQPPNRAIVATEELAALRCASQIDGHLVSAGEVATVLHGPILAVGIKEDGSTRGLTDSEIDEIDEYFSRDGCRVGSGYAAEVEIKRGIDRRRRNALVTQFGTEYPIF